MNDLLRVQIVHCHQDFENESFYPMLRDKLPVLVLYVLVEVTFVAVLKKNAKHLLVLEAALEPADVRMVKVFHQLAF